MKAALYARVSTKDKGQDTENQLIQLREYCAKEKWIIVQEYVDHVTGKHGERPEFKRLFADADRKKFDVVLFWALDRLTREGTLKTLVYLEHLDDFGIHFRSLTEPWLDSLGPFRDVVLALLATLAKQERERLAERINAGLARARLEGRIGGRPKVKIDEDEIRQLRASGMSLRKIGDRFEVSYMTIVRILAKGSGDDGRTQQDGRSFGDGFQANKGG